MSTDDYGSFHPLYSLLMVHTFLVLLLPLVGALFYYSTPHSRRQPIFILNVITLTLTFIGGVLIEIMDVRVLLSPQNFTVSIPLQIISGSIFLFQGNLVDAILLVRLIVIHPMNLIGPVRFALLISLPIMLKIARMINAILYINQLCLAAKGPNGSFELSFVWFQMPYTKVEWIFQVTDNSYVSAAFLWTIWRSRVHSSSQGLISTITLRQTPFAERLRILFNLALSNFLIPTFISIALLILDFRTGSTINTTIMDDIGFVNPTLSSVCVLFATVWAGKQQSEAHSSENSFPAERERRPIYELDRHAVGSYLTSIHFAGVDNQSSFVSNKDVRDLDQGRSLSSLGGGITLTLRGRFFLIPERDIASLA